MKKYFIYTLILASVVITFASCQKSFLKENLYSSYAPETLSDSLGVESSLSGLYYNFSQWYTYSGEQGWLCVWQGGTDIAYPVQPVGWEIPYTNYSLLISTDGAAQHAWQWAYRLISDANTIVQTLHSSATEKAISEAGRNEDEAEARFFRGLAYEKLATFFGAVPLITTPVSGPETDFTRTSLDSVNSQIISDLSFAAQYLPDVNNVKSNSAGKMYERVNKAAAQQELAVAYLRTGDPTDALVQTQAIIGSGDFSLIDKRYGVDLSQPGDYYHDMFIYGNERRSQGNSEAIWVLEQENPSTVNGGISDDAQMRRVWGAAYYQMPGMIICDSLGGRGIGRMRLNDWVLYGLYQNGDIRNSQYNIKRNYYYNNPTYAKYGQLIMPGDGGSVKNDTLFKICGETTKWFAFDPNDLFGYATIKDIIVMRLGETYLLQAEAQVDLGNYADAATSINVLRQRAFANYPAQGMITAADIQSSGNQGLDFILDERARELVAEENRRETLMRMGLLYERVENHIAPSEEASAGLLPYPIQELTNDKAKYLPIPQSEIELNKDAVLSQNTGY
ncbi:MAG TPA: RagB/SusD family nutrient uptake outer membrane protein [Hanamia sp.]|nr:RagB/SusD family nutrient uptake outer membrane protein [Hanamia sp.]